MATVTSSEQALRLVRSRAPRLGGTHLLCVDGPAGSGKTTLAAGVAALEPAAVVVHTDDLLDGWDGLPGLPGTLAALVEPLAAGRATAYRRYDWLAGRYAETVPVPATPLLVLEGVGSGCRRLDPWRSALVWVEAPQDLRIARGLARDGAEAEPHWRRWLVTEARHFAEQRTRAAADLLVDGAGGAPGPA